ncbi:peptidase M48, Ste24p [Corchorus olitorius]|uniref:Peptidase M48, Ste24p n=1 Tax=Corchorus olitorius TaxID=93759 RepID=A0A1R3JGN1_9ROSI|nr:peptidase M48, Ste24p [Corchorus olitorius]
MEVVRGRRFCLCEPSDITLRYTAGEPSDITFLYTTGADDSYLLWKVEKVENVEVLEKPNRAIILQILAAPPPGRPRIQLISVFPLSFPKPLFQFYEINPRTKNPTLLSKAPIPICWAY